MAPHRWKNFTLPDAGERWLLHVGAVDYTALRDGKGDLFPVKNPAGSFTLYRIGDAVHARNIHAGIYDALRYGIRW
jgi:hypothetical protein